MAYSYNPQPYRDSKRDARGRLASERDRSYRHYSYSYDSPKDDLDIARRPRPRSPLTPSGVRFSRHESWPPPPSVEDEGDSLSRELLAIAPSKSNDGEVSMRGTVDQEPLMVEIDNRERRFVLVPEEGRDGPSLKGRTNVRASEEATRARPPRPPPVKTDMELQREPDILSRREPTPYAYTAPSLQRGADDQSIFAESLPSSATSSTPESLRDHIPRHWDSARPREAMSDSSTSKSRNETSDESDLDPKAALRMRSRKKAAPVSFTNAAESATLLSPRLPTNPAKPSRSPSPQPAQPSTSAKRDSQRETASRTPRTAEYAAPVSKPSHSDSFHRSNIANYEAARRTARNSERGWPPSPPRSPKLGESESTNSSPRNSLGSRPGSCAGPRPSSPALSHFDAPPVAAKLSKATAAKFDHYATYPPLPKVDHTRSTSMNTSIQQESKPQLPRVRTDVQSPQPMRPVVSSAVLPYPEDDHSFLMPTEADFSPASQNLGAPFPSLHAPRSRSANPPSTNSRSNPSSSSRPNLPLRHSVAEGLPKSKGEPATKSSTPVPESASSESGSKRKSGSDSKLLPILPPCPRREYSRKYDGWYTIQGFTAFDVCPSCLEDIVLPTPLRKFFKRSSSRPSGMKTRCDFGSPWVRLAWLLTLKRGHQDLDMLYRISKIADTESECPGAAESHGTMYGIPLENGAFLPSFTICPADRKNLETLFPSLTGVFTRLPSTIKIDRICALRLDSKRFAPYLDALAAVDEKASSRASSKSKPDLSPLIDLSKGFSYKQECQRDILQDQTWYFPPSLPDFTVCEECFDELIYPHIKKGPSIADKFNRSLQPLAVPGLTGKATCQLYSPRMRRVWERSVEKGDWEYLKRKVKERRVVEDECRAQQQELIRMLNRGGVDRERLKKELNRIAAEWADWE